MEKKGIKERTSKYILEVEKLIVIKRNGTEVEFDKERIKKAIELAMNSPTGVFIYGQADAIAAEIEEWAKKQKRKITIHEIEDMVHDKLSKRDNGNTARAYLSYKSVQDFKRVQGPSDESILGLVRQTDDEIMNENSNKNATIISTQRDLIAGEVTKDKEKKKILPTNIMQAHDSAVIHIHDMDYMLSPSFNC